VPETVETTKVLLAQLKKELADLKDTFVPQKNLGAYTAKVKNVENEIKATAAVLGRLKSEAKEAKQKAKAVSSTKKKAKDDTPPIASAAKTQATARKQVISKPAK
jgi:hypothetical protein